MKRTWKIPQKEKLEIAKYYWVYSDPGVIKKARLIDGKWMDKNYIVVKNVVLYADDIPPDMPTVDEIKSITED